MSAEPPDSRGMGCAWKCLSMSDTVWNHKWWTWHCPLSFTDKRKCWEGKGDWKVKRGRREKKKRTRSSWGAENLCKHFCEMSQGRSKVTECRGRHQRKWQQLTLLTLLAGRMWCAGIILHKSSQNIDVTASFPGMESPPCPLWAATATSWNVLGMTPGAFKASVVFKIKSIYLLQEFSNFADLSLEIFKNLIKSKLIKLWTLDAPLTPSQDCLTVYELVQL